MYVSHFKPIAVFFLSVATFNDGENIDQGLSVNYFWSLPLFLQTFHTVTNGYSFSSKSLRDSSNFVRKSSTCQTAGEIY